MGFFTRLFGGDEALEKHPGIKFGRYSDAYKETWQYDAWDLALEKFEKEKYLDSYEAFLRYLYDEGEDNVRWERKGNKLFFEILQGSKKVKGIADGEKLKVETKIAIVDQLNIGFMRRLMELNYDLKYSCYSLDDDNDIAMKFDTYVLDGSPYKLYYALKEVATKADKLDDLLIDEFKMLHATDISLQKDIPEAEKLVKYDFIIREIQAAFNEIDNGALDASKYPGGVGYMLLDLCYKLDYLTQPEGFMMETLERIHRLYFAKDNKKMTQKNRILRREFQNLLDRSRADYFKEMYRVNSTFGITMPVSQDRIRNFIDAELHHMDWYLDHGYHKYALAVPGFIIGYCMFYYAVPRPVRDYFSFYYRITESEFFRKLGFKPDYWDAQTSTFNKKMIKKKIREIAHANEDQFPRIAPNTGLLKFRSLAGFAKSFLMMIYQLDTTKV